MFKFLKKAQPVAQAADLPISTTTDNPEPENGATTITLPVNFPESPDEAPYQSYMWITDEGLLRDEGILFGLSGGKIDEKIEAINHYYAAQMMQASRKIEFLEEGIQENSASLLKYSSEETSHKNRIKEINEFKPVDVQHGFWDTISFIGFCAVVACNYFLIYQTGSKAWEYPATVATGVYLFGLLSLFNKASILFSSESAAYEHTQQVEKWKLFGQEVAVPFVAALYMTISGWIYHRPELALVSGLIIFFLFLYAGKALFRQIGFLRAVFNYFINTGKARRWRKQHTQELQDVILKLQSKQEILLQTIKDLKEKQQLIRLPQQIEKDRDTSIKLFESEYKLALESRKVVPLDKLTNLN